MCKCGCHNEDCWGDCTVSYNYCDVERWDKIKELKCEIKLLERTIKYAEKESDVMTAASLGLWICDLKEDLSKLEESEEEKEYRLEREEENREK